VIVRFRGCAWRIPGGARVTLVPSPRTRSTACCPWATARLLSSATGCCGILSFWLTFAALHQGICQPPPSAQRAERNTLDVSRARMGKERRRTGGELKVCADPRIEVGAEILADLVVLTYFPCATSCTVGRVEASHPPPRASIRSTLATMRRVRIFTAETSSCRAIVCDVITCR